MSWSVRLMCIVICLQTSACSKKVTDEAHTSPTPTVEAVDSSTGTIVVELVGVSGATVHFTGPEDLKLSLAAPAIACSMPAGTWSIRVSAPAYTDVNRDVVLPPQGNLSLVIEMGTKPSTPESQPLTKGLVFNGKEIPATTSLRLSDFRAPESLSLTRSYAGKKLVEPRQYDGEPVASLPELQWKVRGVILHAFKARTPQERLEELLKAREGRHFLISTQGQIHQLTDLVNQVPVLDRYHDRTTIHIGLQIPLTNTKTTASATINGQPTAMPPFTDAQHSSLKLLLKELNHHLPRIHLKTPTRDRKTVMEAIAWPRLFRGVLGRFHVDSASVLPGPGLDFERILPLPSATLPSLGQSNEQALWIKGATETSRLVVKGPKGAKIVGTHSLVVCRPSLGQWKAESVEANGQRHSGKIEVATTNLSVLPLSKAPQGTLIINDSQTRTASITGPDSYSTKSRLPATLKNLQPGTYRISVASAEVGHTWAIRVDDDKTSTMTRPASPGSPSTIVIAGQPFLLDEDVPVVTFESRQGHSFYRAQKEIGDKERLFETRKRPNGQRVKDLNELGEVVRMAVLHADVLDDIETAFHVLHSKGLSSHFGIDFDGTIYQMLDPLHVAFGAAEVNPISIQIDLNNRMHNLLKEPQAPPYPRDHRRSRKMQSPRHKRPLSAPEIINGKPYKAYGYTEAQYRSLVTLLRTLSGVLKDLELDFPAPSAQGSHEWADEYEDFRGIVAHFHLTPRRWDPGPGFNWKRLQEALSGRSTSP